MAIEPITRKERFLAKAGGQQVGDLKPITREEMFLSKIGGGGGSTIQPDWNQNDPNAPDYVKNRTHYEELKTIIEEREVRAWFEFGERAFVASRMPRVGEKLTIMFNGNTYKCTVWEEDVIRLGNGETTGINKGENVPFAIRFWVNGEEVLATISTVSIGDNTISIVDDSGNTLLEETFNIEFYADGSCLSPDFPLDQSLIVGNTYKVVYDGVPYECVAWEDSGDIYLGNGEIDGNGHSEDVPFMIATYYDDGELVWYLAFYGTDSHTISVSEVAVHKLDPKYLPDVGGGESYDLDIFQLDHQGPTLLSGDYNTVKTKILNREFVKVRYRHVYGQSNSYDYPVFHVMYNEENEEIEISFFDSDISEVYVRRLFIKPDNRFD